MMSVIQRVSQARVEVDGRITGQIGQGLLVLLCAERGDTEAEADKLLAKLLKLRIFSDEAGKMNKSLQDVGGGLLVVSQFTLAADTRGQPPQLYGRRRPTKADASTNTLWTRPGWPTLRCRPVSLLPICRCIWSMTGPSPFPCAWSRRLRQGRACEPIRHHDFNNSCP